MKLFGNKKVDISIKGNVLNKLRKVSDQEVIRWMDNIHSGLGMNIQELRKSSGTYDQALIYLDDISKGAISLLAAVEVMKERRETNW